MSQVNKYADKAGYTADKNRKDTQSAVSYVEDDGVLIYDGVNTVIRKSAAGVGDLVVFDKTDSTLKFIKGDTLVTEKIPPQLIPVAVVYARQGERVLIVSLRNAASSVCWAYSYEVALSGFELSAGEPSRFVSIIPTTHSLMPRVRRSRISPRRSMRTRRSKTLMAGQPLSMKQGHELSCR